MKLNNYTLQLIAPTPRAKVMHVVDHTLREIMLACVYVSGLEKYSCMNMYLSQLQVLSTYVVPLVRGYGHNKC